MHQMAKSKREHAAPHSSRTLDCVLVQPRLTWRLYHQHFGAGVRYPKAGVVLRVIN